MPVCNGCGRDAPTTREHLIHRAVGRAILGNESLSTDEVRRQLRSGYYRFAETPGQRTHDDVRTDWYVENLLCADCNSGWARDLEERAGANLFGFLHRGSTLDANLIKRWIVFFQFKAWMYYSRTEALREGPFLNLYDMLSIPNTTVSLPVYVAALDADPTTWEFSFHIDDRVSAVSPGFLLVTHGFVWFLPLEENASVPFAAVEVTDGMTRQDVPIISPTALRAVIPDETIEGLAE